MSFIKNNPNRDFENFFLKFSLFQIFFLCPAFALVTFLKSQLWQKEKFCISFPSCFPKNLRLVVNATENDSVFIDGAKTSKNPKCFFLGLSQEQTGFPD